MKERGLGRLGARVSVIGLGTAQLANTDGLAPNANRIAHAEAVNILDAALEGGVTFFDTGDQYGAAEELLGAIPPARRSRATIATKAGLRSDGLRDFSPPYLGGRIERSLRRLRAGSLDLFQLNKPKASDWESGELAAFLVREKTAGRIRSAGVVVGDPEDGLRALRVPAVDCVQVLFHLLYHDSDALIAEAARLGKGVIIRSPLNSGLLAGVYDESSRFQDERSRFFTGELLSRRMAAVREIRAELGISPAELFQFAIRFCLSQPGVSTVIPGASTTGQVRLNIGCGDLAPFDAAEFARIKQAVKGRAASLQGPFQGS